MAQSVHRAGRMHAHFTSHRGGALFVVGALPESPSARAGLRYGDVLLECNGMPVDGPTSLDAARASNADRLELVVLRRGEAVELRVELDGGTRASEAPVPGAPALRERTGDHRLLMRSHTLDTSAPFVESELF